MPVNLYQEIAPPRGLGDLSVYRRAGGIGPFLYQNDFYGRWWAQYPNLLFADDLTRRRGAAPGEGLEVGGSFAANDPGMSYALGAGAYNTSGFSRYIIPCAFAPTKVEGVVRVGAAPPADAVVTLELRFGSANNCVGADFDRSSVSIFYRGAAGTTYLGSYTRPAWWQPNSLERLALLDDGSGLSAQIGGVTVLGPISTAQGAGNKNATLAFYTGGVWKDLWVERIYGRYGEDTTPPATQMFLFGA